MNKVTPHTFEPIFYGQSGTLHSYGTNHPREQIQDERYFGTMWDRFLDAKAVWQPDEIRIVRRFTWHDREGREHPGYDVARLMVIHAERGIVRTKLIDGWHCTHEEEVKAEAQRDRAARAREAKEDA